MKFINTLSALCFGLEVTIGSAFIATSSRSSSSLISSTRLNDVQDIPRPPTFLDEDDDGDLNILFIDEDDEDYDDGDDEPEAEKPTGEGRKRWENLNPKIKQRLIEMGQAKAIASKKKREPAQDKKRRKCAV